MYKVLLGTMICLSLPLLSATAVAQTCGDSLLAAGENCDDGNAISGDGCSSQCLAESGYTCNAPFNLAQASVEEWGSNSSWTISGDGRTATAPSNSESTVLILDGFDPTLVPATFGVAVLQSGGDDDFIGFTIGIQPGDATSATADFLLIDWKQGDQNYNPWGGFAAEGLAVSQVQGVSTNADLWTHSGTVTELARGTNYGDVGWTDQVFYSFDIQYDGDSLQVYIDGALELDIDETSTGVSFPSGGFLGVYAFSQANAFFNWTGALASECISTCGDGIVASDEPCDDGALTDSDGCSQFCDLEPLWTCSGEPSVCEADSDEDGIGDSSDNCPATANTGQSDLDSDGTGDACDPCPIDNPDDSDSDGVCNSSDACTGDDATGDSDGDGV